jgi:hypothetical protein
MVEFAERAAHWDTAYRDNSQHSWDQAEPTPSLAMLDGAMLSPSDSVIDVGGRSSPLVDCLLERGSSDVAVLDVSDVALAATRSRLGSCAAAVQ